MQEKSPSGKTAGLFSHRILLLMQNKGLAVQTASARLLSGVRYRGQFIGHLFRKCSDQICERYKPIRKAGITMGQDSENSALPYGTGVSVGIGGMGGNGLMT